MEEGIDPFWMGQMKSMKTFLVWLFVFLFFFALVLVFWWVVMSWNAGRSDIVSREV